MCSHPTATIDLLLVVLASVAAAVHAQALPPTPVNVCTGHAHLALVRNTRDCGSFYQCLNGRPFHNSCGSQLLFNHITRRCEQADKVECFACPADELFIDMPVVNECQQFVRCFNNQSEQLTCAEGLMFDRDAQMCNLRANVTCPWEPVCPPRNEDLVFIRDRTNCAKFYLCMNGKPVNRTCPPTLFFNTLTNQCDLATNVECESVS